jgi:hypothetical protein
VLLSFWQISTEEDQLQRKRKELWIISHESRKGWMGGGGWTEMEKPEDRECSAEREGVRIG